MADPNDDTLPIALRVGFWLLEDGLPLVVAAIIGAIIALIL